MNKKGYEEVLSALVEWVDGATDIRKVPRFPQHALTDNAHLFRIIQTLDETQEDWDEEFSYLNCYYTNVFNDRQGYRAAYLYQSKRTTRHPKRLYRLMASTYLGPKPEGKTLIRHLDGDSLNDSASNLVWGTHAENMEDLRKHKEQRAVLTKELKQQIRDDLLRESGYYDGVKEGIAKRYNVAFTTVCRQWEQVKEGNK